jgi:exodeoxyribonuclease VII small subunit
MKKGMKFETALRELEKIVESLENKEMPLEKALSAFEQGVKLSRYCAKLLDEAEVKVKELSRDEQGQATVRTWEQESAKEGAPDDAGQEEQP